MEREQIAQVVTANVRSVGKLSEDFELRADAHLLDDLEIDSIGMVEIITGVEDELGVSIADSELVYKDVTVVGDLVDRIVLFVQGEAQKSR